jgi:PDZ domain-containing secreted protein
LSYTYALNNINGQLLLGNISLKYTSEITQAVKENRIHNIKVVTITGEYQSFSDSLYGAIVRAHYTLNDLWGLNDMMYFDLPGFSGGSGGAATAYEVMLKAKETANNHGHFVVTGTIDPEGLVGSIGGIIAKTYLAIKQSIPVMFVPKGNYNDAIRIKELKHSNITIVPIEKLKDTSAFWDKAED